MIFMSVISAIGNKINEINDLFKRKSVSSNIGVSNRSLRNRISLRAKSNVIDYELGMKILEDTQVSTGFDILKYILSSKQWVLVANENDTDNEVYDFINNMLFNMETELNTIVKQQATAILWGFSVHELLFDINNDGMLYLKNTVPLHIKTLQHEPFTYNTNGELIGVYQKYEKQEVDIPINKILKYSFNANFDEDYGNGLLNDFRPIVEDKLNINEWLMTFLERHESPTLYGKTDGDLSSIQMLNAFEEIADGTAGLTIGREDDVGVLESSHRGETFFRTLQYKDNQIFRRYYLGNLLLGDNSQTGTYAQSNTQLEFGQLIFDGLLEEIANGFQKQVINRIVEWNYGDIQLAPTISFDKFTSGDLEKLFRILEPLMKDGVVDSENDAVQEALALLFKKETGLHYVNEEPEMPDEDFGYQEPVNDDQVTNNILSELDAIAT